jgi:hypothetical protein
MGMALLLVHASQIRKPRFIYFLAALIVLTISVSRLYLGAHWFTDVLGAWLMSSTLLMLITLSYNRKTEKHLETKRLFTFSVITLLMITSFMYARSITTLKQDYTQLDWPTYSVTADDWWTQQKNDKLPLYRIGRVGIAVEVLNLQWIGDLSQIRQELMQQGWTEPPEGNWMDAMHRITDISSAEHLPLVSPLYLDKKPVLVLIKNINGDKKPIVLRLWESNISIKGSSLPLWVGSVGPVPRTYSWLINYKRSNEVAVRPALIFNELPQDLTIKQFTVLTNKNKHRVQQLLLIKPKNLS